ncbi:major intracellular serine protease [Rhypophila decipiens]|uniref:Major intracellular serine protease n=1 Tax=Rhypophila decipiens TaxID=261697 RepID=A0AAN6XX02_9PEZI|nr:major intracellular serine protease [Rhypophila decipiens]
MGPSTEVDGSNREWVDPQVVFSSLGTLQEMAKFQRTQQHDVELKIFYADLTAYCAMIRAHSSYICSGPGRNDVVSRIARHLESVLTCSTLLDTETPAGHRLRDLTSSWEEVGTSSAPDAKLAFLGTLLNFGDAGQRDGFIATLSALEDEIRSSYTEEASARLANDLAPMRKAREPSYAVCEAAQSIFDALLACKECVCNPSHELCARLGLGTYRPSSSDKSDDEPDNDVYFRMLLSNGQDLQPARIRSVRATTVQWSLGDEASQKSRKPQPRPMKVKRLCEPMTKMRTMAAYRLELKVARNQLFKLQSVRDDLDLDKTKDPVSLRQLLGEGSRTFTERTRRILAVILSYTVLHLQDTNWLPPAWGSSNIFFFRTATSAIPLRPFIHIPIADPGPGLVNGNHDHDDGGSDDLDPDDFDPDDLDPDDFVQHQCPNLVTLAIMLMEVYFMTPFEFLVKRFGDDHADTDRSSGALRYIDALVVFQACKREIPENSQFHYAIDRCLDPTVWENEDGMKLDHDTLSSKIYSQVVLPLETELSQAYSSIPIDDLDRFAQSIDFSNWDQAVAKAPAPPNPPTMLTLDQLHLPFSTRTSRGPSPVLEPSSPFTYLPIPSSSNIVQPYDEYSAPRLFDDEVPSAYQTPQSQTSYRKWKAQYQAVYEKFIPFENDFTALPPVKVAILDSGLDLNHPDIADRHKGIRSKYNLLDEGRPKAVHDRIGHGTFVTSVLLDYAPDSHVHVAKIADSNTPPSPSAIAKAILHAVDVWKVDIITMSFGFPTSSAPSYKELEASLKHAYSRDVLLFAAASNNGGRLGRSFPAREPTVIAVHSTDTSGNRSSFSPTPVAEDINLATVGESVRGAWPVHLLDHAPSPSPPPAFSYDSSWTLHKSGTSFATPILAGIAAFLLTYARIHLTTEQATALRSHRRMQAVLRRLAEKGPGGYRHEKRDGYYFVDISLYEDSLFGKDKAFIDATLGDLLK